jgi:DNA-binding HxlR family transcriptional regulator
LQPLLRDDEYGRAIDWIDQPLARVLLRRKHALPILLAVYERGPAGTSELIKRIRGHPESVISTLRALEYSGVLSRIRLHQGRHEVETRLTPRGIQLVETPIYRWERILRKWNLASD